ncbi:MAG: AMP-binding protein, partial [Mycobacterium sp.]
MQSTMQDVPLTITTIMRYASEVNGDRTITTAVGDGRHRTLSYRELGEQAGRLANALRALGIDGDARVATFMWNNAEHVAAYLAVPSMGAVLHTLNIRLAPEQIAYIANEAEDRVIIADLSLTAQLVPVLPLLDTVHTVIAVGDGDLAPLAASGKTVLRYGETLAAQPPEFDWPNIDETSAAAMCYTSGTTGNPKGVVYSHRSSYLHAMNTCTANSLGIGAEDSVLPILPMFHANAGGLPYAALMAGADLVLTDQVLDAKSNIDVNE